MNSRVQIALSNITQHLKSLDELVISLSHIGSNDSPAIQMIQYVQNNIVENCVIIANETGNGDKLLINTPSMNIFRK